MLRKVCKENKRLYEKMLNTKTKKDYWKDKIIKHQMECKLCIIQIKWVKKGEYK
jgi:hypothetical protein